MTLKGEKQTKDTVREALPGNARYQRLSCQRASVYMRQRIGTPISVSV